MLRIICLLLLLSTSVYAAPPVKIIVQGDQADATNVVCTVAVPVANRVAVNSLKLPDGTLIPAQTVPLKPRKDEVQEITFVLPKLAAGQTVRLELTDFEPKTAFHWDEAGKKLTYGLQPAIELVRPEKFVAPEKGKETANPTSKPYHHLYDATGQVRLSNGPDGKFPHHRGIYFGFNKCSYDGKDADVWHCTGGAHQFCTGVTGIAAGPAFGTETLAIDWVGKDGKPFAREKRTVTAYRIGEATLIDFASTVTTVSGGPAKVRLDGDPQHAGFHFRANAEVEKSANETYYLRPMDTGEKGKERNWDAKGKDPLAVNLPWNAMCFVLEGKRYTAVYLDHPTNPKEARYSERNYGRFGSYFEYDLTEDKPLKVHYRLWMQPGEATREACASLSHGFVVPPKIISE